MASRTNTDALNGITEKEIGLSDLDGFQLPVDLTQEFMTRMQKSSPLLNMAYTQTLPRLEMKVPEFGVPRLSGHARGEEESRTQGSGAESGEVKYNATGQQYYILVEPERDALKNTRQGPANMGQYIVNQFVERWANDATLIGMRAGAANGNLQSVGGAAALDNTWNGWVALAEGADTVSDRIGLEDTAAGDEDTMPVYDNAEDNTSDATDNPTPQAVDTEMFNGAIQTLDSRYRDPDDVVFITNPDHVQQYHYDLTNREDGLGVAVLQGENDVTPFSYDVIGIPEWPVEYAMFTDPSNLAFGVFEEMEVDQTTDTDKVHEERLHSRNWMEGQFDFQIRDMQAGVLVTNLADPTGA